MSDLVGFGFLQHHEPPCPPAVGCNWCNRERSRQAPERVRLRESQEMRIGRPRRYRGQRRLGR